MIRAAGERPRWRWLQRLAGLAWVVFCFELGVFLLVYPWMTGWETNDLVLWLPVMRPYWSNSYLRGAVSGLGVVNIYISLVELFYFLRSFLENRPV